MNKAFDLNKHMTGKQRPIRVRELEELSEWYVEIKRDGHYTTVVKHLGEAKYFTSAGNRYTPAEPTWLDDIQVPCGVYICERCHGKGLLGDRGLVALYGPHSAKKSKASDNFYVHDYLSLDEYYGVHTPPPFSRRAELLDKAVPIKYHEWVSLTTPAINLAEAKKLMAKYVKQGYEGIMLKHKSWVWKDTTSRSTKFMKWKARPTADLYCIRTIEGEGQYQGQIGSLLLQDSQGRLVKVGSGLTDFHRVQNEDYFLHKVVEIEYEQILSTYIQPVFIQLREDKKEID